MPIMPDVPAQLLKRARSLRRSSTKSEDIFWKRARNGQISGLKFRRQVPIHGLIVDFACFSHCLVVEIDGGIHGLSEVQKRDRDRDAKLKHFGYRVLRFSDRAIFEELETVIGLIEDFARLR
ncbi:endonuclease domain-containing protein [Aquidulcibacter sp.]|jgi:very-short-patch-repair endonuclease|uniref:endonuclease domain-containing protein n=1 Tax=Aquidulcibacter sp. TaxID=2052990 RepID=UPI00378431BF